MKPQERPNLVESARRNPGVKPDRVIEMQEVVKQLHDRGILKPPTYGLQPGLSAPKSATASHGLRMMNRIGAKG